MGKSPEEMFVDDGSFDWAKFRGAFVKYVEYLEDNEGVSDKRPVLNPGDGMIGVVVTDFDTWLDRKLDGSWHEWRNQYNLFPKEKEAVRELLSDKPGLQERLEKCVKVYSETDGEAGTVYSYYNGGNSNNERDVQTDRSNEESNGQGGEMADDEDGSGDSPAGSGSGDSGRVSGSGYSGPFEELVDVGIVRPDHNLDKDKLRGAMVKFVRGVGEVVGPKEEPSEKQVREAFNRWMQDNFGKEWVQFIHSNLEPGEFRAVGEAMWEKNEAYRNKAKQKWNHDPEQFEGNGDKEVNSDDGDDGTKSNKHRIDSWTGSSSDNMDNTGDGVHRDDGGNSSQGDDGGGKRKSRRYRLKEFEDVKADGEDMWDFDEIRNTIIRENVWTAMDKIPSNSVDVVVTSPPYWGLRDYDGSEFAPIGGEVGCDHKFHNGKCYKCDAWQGQLGHEPEPQMFVDNIVAIMSKIRRILKPTGSVFLNVGDNYAREDFRGDVRTKRKSMMMIPERIYMTMTDLDWVLRNKVIWVKRILFNDNTVKGAANPTSVTDRINYVHEPLYWLTSNPDYYSDIYAVRREHQTDASDMSNYDGKYDSDEYDDEMYNSPTARAAREGYEPSMQHDAGANIPNVWRVPTGSASKEHPAVYSPDLCVRPIKMACPEKVCANCKQPYSRIVEEGDSQGWNQGCNCHTNDTEPGVVFDPFCGRGTTLKVAAEEGRDWVTTEVSDKYADFAEDYIPDSKGSTLEQWT